jgi:hypothetical protein
MKSLDDLPNFPLKPSGEITARFLELGVTDFHSAARYVHRIPYGRNADRANFRLVLQEGRGTCSTKHTILAQLAKEQDINIGLAIGIYEMTERNTPGVGPVLTKHGLPSLPEAHCYLTYDGRRVDVTRSSVIPSEPIQRFLYEETIVPDQIGRYKTELHQRFIKNWAVTSKVVGSRDWQEIWQIREECIAALSE